ncbi:MAG: CHAT domain-containing protein [Chloroflexales bacterium]|nr:CHAT domain-containing protein [Chloroflexales bacterium]
MPISLQEIHTQVLARTLTPATTVAELLRLFQALPPAQQWEYYAVVRLDLLRYDILTLDDLGALSPKHGPALLRMTLEQAPGLLKPAAPLYAPRVDAAAAERAAREAPRRCLAVLDEQDRVLGVWGKRWSSKGLTNPLALLSLEMVEPEPAPPPTRLSLPDEEAPPPYLNTRFEGIGPNDLLPVGVRVPLVIAVGAQVPSTRNQSSRPFKFRFDDATTSVAFRVKVDADPELWSVEAVEPTLLVAPPGTTLQEAEFLITAKQPASDKLHICVERQDTGAVVQHVWLPAVASLADDALPTACSFGGGPALSRTETSLPLDSTTITRRQVELTVQPDVESFVIVVRADFLQSSIRATYRLSVNPNEVQNAVLRLRQELARIVAYELQREGQAIRPFLSATTLDIDHDLARKVAVPLADAGEQIWRMLFAGPRTPAELRQFAADLRNLPAGSSVQVVLDSQQWVMPWALLYDKPGPINAATLDWSGFWGYRYVLDTLPPGRYPAPEITDAPPTLQILLNDDRTLEPFTTAQVQWIQTELSGAPATIVWGDAAAQQALTQEGTANLLYCYCHGDRMSGAERAGALASESRLSFSQGRSLRLADLRRLPAARLGGRPLVFLNACEGATQEAFFYDGFMPFFIEELGARGFIGAEVKVPQLLAHDFALKFLHAFATGQPVGQILWVLRRQYLEQHHNILAFSYSLYGLGELRLAQPLVQRSATSNEP